MVQVFLVGPIEQLQPGGDALNAVLEVHPAWKGRIAFASAALRTDPADMLLDFFGLDRSIRDAIQVMLVDDSSFLPAKALNLLNT